VEKLGVAAEGAVLSLQPGPSAPQDPAHPAFGAAASRANGEGTSVKLIDENRIADVHPNLRHLIPQLLAMKELDEIDPLEFRATTREMLGHDGDREPVGRVDDRQIPGRASIISIRIYTPEATGTFPIMMFFHGGGWVAGDLETHDRTCRALCNLSGFIVVAVDYRLGPEAKFPAAVEDCFDATCWAAQNAESIRGDSQRLVIAGDSAGGGLAAAVALMSRDLKGPKIRHQLLAYAGLEQSSDFVQGYLRRREDAVHPYASPLLADDLSGLPSATIVTAQCDPITRSNSAYAARLIDVGVNVNYRCYPGMLHGFLDMPEVAEIGRRALQQMADDARSTV
jgi:acetyl esterase